MKQFFHRAVAFGRWVRFHLFSAYPAMLFDASLGAGWDATMVLQSGLRVRRRLGKGENFAKAFKTWPLVLIDGSLSLLDMAQALENAIAMAQKLSLEGVTVHSESGRLREGQMTLVVISQLSPVPIDIRLYQDLATLDESIDTLGAVSASNIPYADKIPLSSRLRVARPDRNAARETLKQMGLKQHFVAVAFPQADNRIAKLLRGVIEMAAGTLPYISFVILFSDNVVPDMDDPLTENPRVLLTPLLGCSFLQSCCLLSECDVFLGVAGFFSHLAETHALPSLTLRDSAETVEDIAEFLSQNLPRRTFRHA